jgi:predicted metal-dependent phosphoesterase TrpH
MQYKSDTPETGIGERKGQTLIKADLHVHTCYSMDSETSLEQVIDRCRKTGINCVAIADHGTVDGALKLREIAPFKVIVAEEILTPAGEIMGLFLNKTIPSEYSVEETIARIREQGGLVSIPHPFDTLRFSAFKSDALKKFMGDIDIIEVLNARSLSPGSNAMAKNTAKKHGKLMAAGSDAHTPGEIGQAYIEMPDFNTRDEFVAAMAQGVVRGGNSNPFVHFASTRTKLKKRLGNSENGV